MVFVSKFLFLCINIEIVHFLFFLEQKRFLKVFKMFHKNPGYERNRNYTIIKILKKVDTERKIC